ncbi:hypothetical protein [Edwardsiella tarda]|uniref:hypothetical protein n=1 Tax=Edwardsiella tarda TaxID=636 RepID=UPI00098FE257|nr:hypothetical protein [Edwardsiella tarda]
MTTITKERLIKIQQWRETYGAGHNVILPAEEAEELARIALASLETTPIYQVKYGNDWRDVERGQYDDHAGHGSPIRVVYTAPPVPVVPDEIPLGLTSQIINLISSDLRDHNLTQRIWNACRAAMLNSPSANKGE